MALTNAKLHAGINLSKILLNYIFGGEAFHSLVNRPMELCGKLLGCFSFASQLPLLGFVAVTM